MLRQFFLGVPLFVMLFCACYCVSADTQVATTTHAVEANTQVAPQAVEAEVQVAPAVTTDAVKTDAQTSSVVYAPEANPLRKTIANQVFHCMGCHGLNGYKMGFPKTYHVPLLGGQHAAYIMSALKAYRDGSRKFHTMGASSWPMSEDDMKMIAHYYASERPIASESGLVLSDEWVKKGAQVYEKYQCATCHGVSGANSSDLYPIVAGQSADYLVQSLLAYQKGLRQHAVMQMNVKDLSHEEIEEVSIFLSHQKGVYLKH